MRSVTPQHLVLLCLVTLVSLTFVAVSPCSATDYTSRLRNADFESLSGWPRVTTGSGLGYYFTIGLADHPNYPAQNGDRALYVGGNGSGRQYPGDGCFATQDVDLTDVNTISFWYRNDGGGGYYLKFSLSELGASATISNARLYVYLNDEACSRDRDIGVYSARDNWSERYITWNNAPSRSR